MEDIEKLNEQFLHIQGLLSNKDFAAAIELLDSMFKEYSAIDWVGDNKITDAESEQMQKLHYVYKDFYAHHLITYYCQLFTALVSLLDEAAKYKNSITKAYAHVDSILAELENL